MPGLRELAERTPPQRERYVDLLRALAILIVVLGHWTVIVVTGGARGLDGFSALEVLPWGRPIAWPVQVMPVFFMVGRFANAASLTSHTCKGGGIADWLLDRSARLARPTTALLVTLAAAALIGEAKATVQPRGLGDLERLEHIRTLLTDQGHRPDDTTLALFSLHGFHPDVIDAAGHRRDVLLVDIGALYGDGPVHGLT